METMTSRPTYVPPLLCRGREEFYDSDSDSDDDDDEINDVDNGPRDDSEDVDGGVSHNCRDV